VRSWVIAIARRQTRDRLRGRRLRVLNDAFLADQPGPGPGPDAPSHREVLGLVFGSGLSLPEIAGALAIPVGTVKSRLTAARAALSRYRPRIRCTLSQTPCRTPRRASWAVPGGAPSWPPA
jgi:RNA polymerase sigma-70 factor, ECF subfamily